jgi:8-oxo-dGTP diphosphatase
LETHLLVDAQVQLPVVDPLELRTLAARYGNPIYRCYDIEADDHLRRHRWKERPDRRGEVVFAIRQPNGEILLHTKPQYREEIYRLPTGGIHPDEGVEDALYREIAEETGQPVVLRRFLGLLNCRFHLKGKSVTFPSYIFYLESLTDELNGSDPCEIAAYQTVPPEQLTQVAWRLRCLKGKRQRWGYWRSLCHDLVYQYLTCPEVVTY